MKILIAKEKHETRYLDASTNEAFAKSALKILTERLERGWYLEPRPPKTNLLLSKEEAEALPEPYRTQELKYHKQHKIAHDAYQYELDWYNQMLQVTRAQDTGFTTSKYPMPKAWALLADRLDYEYEEIRIEDVEE